MRGVIGEVGVFWEGSPESWIKYIAVFDKDHSGNPAGGYAWTILLGKKTVTEMTYETVALLPKLNQQRDRRFCSRRILPAEVENVIQKMLQ